MYPTIFRFKPAPVEAEVPPNPPASASELRYSERGHVIAGSGWFALREGLSLARAMLARRKGSNPRNLPPGASVNALSPT